MPVTLGGNILSLQAQTELSKNSSALSTVFERLSSGVRINHASDDPAGLALASTLGAESRVYSQGLRNVNDGISLLNIAEAALTELTTIVTRIHELAAQASNGTFTSAQRVALDSEAQALANEYLRVAQSTTFNRTSIFSSSFGTLTLQAGYGSEGSLSSTLGGEVGDGTLGAATAFATATVEAHDIALGDINSDGVLDMVSVGDTGATGYATVRLGTGGGSFGAAVTYSTGDIGTAFGQSVDLEDVNNDGVLDLLTAGSSAGGGMLNVRLGQGNGSFGAALSFSTAFSFRATELIAGDVNGDGSIDLVAAGYNGATGSIHVQLGNGDGTFAASTTYLTEVLASFDLDLRDLNGDGALDVVTAGADNLGDGYATVRLGGGDGTFGAATSYLTDSSGASFALMLGDLNGDGQLDMVTGGYNGGGATFTVRLGTGGGAFGSATTVNTGAGQTRDVVLGDLNGDGKLDLMTAGYAANGYLTVQMGNGDGTFRAVSSYSAEPARSHAAAVGDLDADGVLDVVTTGFTNSTVRLGNSTTGVAPLLPFSLLTASDASWASTLLSQKLNQLTEQRGVVGAFTSRLEVTTSLLTSLSSTTRSAADRILEIDVAEEVTELVRRQVLQQSSTAILAQANLQSELVISLLAE